ncbi:alpha/beta-hydrolase [Xylaria bambusicola]|uniref:alpha/beta-hydrolase n=1 Tax=Xylaria bambusicola TaxID=326684 RepID=UPI0020088C16|nr:alpha/beta-hydrolase [Xylaria bambusicola]KAI0515080.1 alpha/beta-hydrolase [Xylaria bambusicola]
MKGATFPTLLASIAGASNINFPFPYNSTTPVPFQASVETSIIEEARFKASLFRPSIDLLDGDISDAGWGEGPPRANMTAVAKHWSKNYDWNKAQDEINGEFSHFAVTIPGTSGYKHPVSLHFVHERSDADEAIPLLLLHGWPSTHREWSKVIDPLRSPTNSSTQAFHIVAPDLPGFGFSPSPTYSGLNAREMGAAMHQLMILLGYDKYGIVGTDLGWTVGHTLAHQVPDSVIGFFSDFWLILPNATDLERRAQNQTTEEETLYIDSAQDFITNHANHLALHSQSPLAIGQAVADTPVGFAGWVWHIVHWFNDGYEYALDELITNTLLLWIPGPFGNIRAYRELIPSLSNLPYVNVPTAGSVWGLSNSPLATFAYLQLTPRSFIERVANVTFYNRHEHGGHFPAQTEPEIWIKDVQDFFGGLVH